MENLLDYLKQEVEDFEKFSPKENTKTPKLEKRRDAKKAFNQNRKFLSRIRSRGRDDFQVDNGIISYDSYRNDGRKRYLFQPFRQHKDKTTNGVHERGDDSLNWMPLAYGKSSRRMMREKAAIEEAVIDYYLEKDFDIAD